MNWIIIDNNDIVQNVIVWDGSGSLNLADGWKVVMAPGARIGWAWNNGDQKPPPEEPA